MHGVSAYLMLLSSRAFDYIRTRRDSPQNQGYILANELVAEVMCGSRGGTRGLGTTPFGPPGKSKSYRTPLKWRFAGNPVMVVFSGIWILSPFINKTTKKKDLQVGHHLTKLSGSVHGSDMHLLPVSIVSCQL